MSKPRFLGQPRQVDLSEESSSSRDASCRVAILCNHNLREWTTLSADGLRAGQLGPYGFEHLAAVGGCRLSWSDAKHRWPWSSAPVGRVAAKLTWHRPELAGWMNWLVSVRIIRRADVVLAVFEDQGLAGATARRVGLMRRKQFVVIVCWAAEHLKVMAPRTRRDVSRALQRVDAIVVYSQNQVDILEKGFGLQRSKIHVVPFGVDESFFDYSPVTEADDYVLFVGRDRSRDLATLLEAAPLIAGQIKVVTSPKLFADSAASENVHPVFNIDHLEYRALLRGARVICLPTHAPAYPGGQTVLLEAMSVGRPCVTTASDAIRDYVHHGRTGLLTEPYRAEELADAVNALLGDFDLARRIGDEARAEVEARFGQRHMWTEVLASVGGFMAEAYR